MRLPQEYETVLGKLFENGEELSIGQWQKIALARAFLRGSQVIVLDEPTSAMDAKAEAEVFERFRELLEGRTAVLISPPAFDRAHGRPNLRAARGAGDRERHARRTG